MITRVVQRRRPRRSAILMISSAVVAAGLVAGVALALVSDAGDVDVQIPNNTTSRTGTTTQGAVVSYIGDNDASLGSSGTGIFNSFVRLQGSPNEDGYNTDGKIEFETKAGAWTKAIKVSGIPVVNEGGVDYWELFVDINDSNTDPKISLDDLEVYYTTNARLTNYAFGANAEKQYDFDGTILINDVNQGSGRGDLRYLIPLTNIALPANCDYLNAACDRYFVLYSQWGMTAGYPSDGGFEEWKVKQYPIPPKLKLVKVVTNDNGGTNAPVDWTLSATGTSRSFSDAGNSTIFHTVSPSVGYALAETGPANPSATYTAGSWSCDGGTLVGSTVTLTGSERVTCTITNNDTKANPAIKTAQGWVLYDTATFTGIRAGAPDASSATVTFKLWSTNTASVCSGQVGTDRTSSISALGVATTATGITVNPTTTTTYYWTAEYSGDQFNNARTSGCGVETTTISFVQPAP